MKNEVIDKVDANERQKLNAGFFTMVEPKGVSAVYANRENATSSFYNSKDMRTVGFYKTTSRMISNDDYERFS
ncbi:MAG: hypothetical protein AAF620_08150 [Bacteroidota bacterium]